MRMLRNKTARNDFPHTEQVSVSKIDFYRLLLSSKRLLLSIKRLFESLDYHEKLTNISFKQSHKKQSEASFGNI